MKKILIAMSVAIFIALCSAPSFVKAAYSDVGVAYVSYYGDPVLAPLFVESDSNNVTSLYDRSGWLYTDLSTPLLFYYNNEYKIATTSNVYSGYISTLTNNFTWTFNNQSHTIYSSYDDYVESLPEELRPEPPSLAQQRWDAFYEWYKLKYGFYPVDDSLIAMLRKLALGDEDANTEIIYPTFAPTPTPTPTPTPIPVQQIFVPDGNGNTTIVYQYPDPTTGLITQSPYNPNIENNITVNCDCEGSGGSGDNTFGTNPQDPYTLTSSMLWADGFGVQISDNPLTAANDSQQTLAEAASEYADSVNVASNSFNILPLKWLSLVGLLGGILIIAGLIRTFLGG